MATLAAGDSTTAWMAYIKANAAGGEVMKALLAALKVSTGLASNDTSTQWRKFHGR